MKPSYRRQEKPTLSAGKSALMLSCRLVRPSCRVRGFSCPQGFLADASSAFKGLSARHPREGCSTRDNAAAWTRSSA